MKAENNRWMIWAIVILAAMNTATFVTILYNRTKSSKETTLPAGEIIQPERSSLRFSGRYFRDHLDLNRDQMTRFTEINPPFRQKARNINIKMVRIRQQMLGEMAGHNHDLSRLNALSDSIGFLHAELKKLTYNYYLDIKKICDSSQQEKLEQMFSVMFAADAGMGGYGRGGPQGRRSGRRANNHFEY